MSTPKITVIIPTRQRCDVLAKSLKTVVAQDYDKLEILVSDNCSTDATEDVVRDFGDPRIRYFRTPARLSMSHNWEFALSNASGDWVSIIGDDDGLLPGSLHRVADIVAQTHVEAIRSRVCSYAWPSITGRRSGHLKVPLGVGMEVRDCAHWLSKVLEGRAAYTDLPMLYNGGFVSLRTLLEIKQRTGQVYRSCIPDVYSAVAIASTLRRYVYTHVPLAINGASKHSTGTSYFSKDKSGEASAALFHSEDIIPCHADVPLAADGRFPKSLQVMILESLLQSCSLRPAASSTLFEDQLEVILATSPSEDSSIVEWGLRFAQAHGLDFSAAKARSIRRRQRLRLTQLNRSIDEESRMLDVGNMSAPIEDVYEASLVADSVRGSGRRAGNKAGILAKRITRKLASLSA